MDRRIIKTRAAIGKAYFEMLAEQGDDRITVSEISRRANIDRKTFYLHYAAVEDIPKEYLGKFAEELIDALNADGYFQHPLRMQLVFKALNSMVSRNADCLRLMINIECGNYFWSKVHPVLVDAMVHVYRDIVRVNEAELRIYCTFLVSGFIRIYLDNLRNGGEMPLDDLARIVMDIISNGGSSIVPAEAVRTEFGE